MASYIDVEPYKDCKIVLHNEDSGVLIQDIPTADVQEMKYGKWKKAMPRRKGRNATYRCSCCGQLRSSYYNDVQNWEYCPCGAKMDKE